MKPPESSRCAELSVYFYAKGILCLADNKHSLFVSFCILLFEYSSICNHNLVCVTVSITVCLLICESYRQQKGFPSLCIERIVYVVHVIYIMFYSPTIITFSGEKVKALHRSF